MSEWRYPTADERQLLDAVLNSCPAPKPDLADRRVRDYCLCPCGSFEIERQAGDPSSRTEVRGWVATATGSATVRFYQDAGVWSLEVTHLPTAAPSQEYGKPDAATFEAWESND